MTQSAGGSLADALTILAFVAAVIAIFLSNFSFLVARTTVFI